MRRASAAKTFLIIAILSTMIGTACSTAWVGEAEQIVAVLIPATANLMTLVAALQGKSVSATDLQTIQSAGAQAGSDLQLIQSLITAYGKADAAAQAGLLSQIQAATSAVQTNLNALLPALHIKDPVTQGKISAVVGLLISEVESMAAIIPMVQSSASPAMMTMMSRQVKKQAPLSASEFLNSYNKTITARTGNRELDQATAGLQLHSHGKLTRWASAGLLK